MTSESLRAWRERMGWRKYRAALELGINQNTYAKYEDGRRAVPRYIALACAAIEHTASGFNLLS